MKLGPNGKAIAPRLLADLRLRGDPPGLFWELLIQYAEYDEGDFADALKNSADYRRLLKYARDVLVTINNRTPITDRTVERQRRGRPKTSARSVAAVTWKDIALVRASLTALDAERDPDVRRFRDEQLGGSALTPDDARAWLRAARGKPAPQPSGKVGTPMSTLIAFPTADGGTARVPATSPALSRLKRLSTRLARDHSWTEQQAVWFLLAGAVPVRWPVEARPIYEVDDSGATRLARIEIVVTDRTLPASAVAREYQRVAGVGRGGRAVSERQLRLALFVKERSIEERPPWSRLRKEWNRAYRRWPYSSEWAFARDAKGALDRLSD